MTFEVGDLVVCVDDSNFHDYTTSPTVKRGDVCCVFNVFFSSNERRVGLELEGRPVPSGFRGWCASRFRKLNDNNGDEEALREIVRCFNAPQPAQPERIKA